MHAPQERIRCDSVAVAWVTVGTRSVPATLVVTVRMPGATFPIPVQVAPGAGVWNLSFGVTANDTIEVSHPARRWRKIYA